jgi:hypothetical protein
MEWKQRTIRLVSKTRTRRETGLMPRGRTERRGIVSKDQHGSWWGGVPPLTPVYRRAVHCPRGQWSGARGASSGGGGCSVQCVSKHSANANRRARESLFETQNGSAGLTGTRHGKRSRVQPTVVRHKSKTGRLASISTTTNSKSRRSERRKEEEGKGEKKRKGYQFLGEKAVVFSIPFFSRFC